MSTMRLSNGSALAQRGGTVAIPSRWRARLRAIGRALSRYGQQRAAAQLDRLAWFYARGDAALALQLRRVAADCRAQAEAGRALPINEESNG